MLIVLDAVIQPKMCVCVVTVINYNYVTGINLICPVNDIIP